MYEKNNWYKSSLISAENQNYLPFRAQKLVPKDTVGVASLEALILANKPGSTHPGKSTYLRHVSPSNLEVHILADEHLRTCGSN